MRYSTTGKPRASSPWDRDGQSMRRWPVTPIATTTAYNDRLPGAVRNAYIGPGYFTVDLRISKGFQLSERVRLTLLAESFNVSNRVNQRVDITDDGFLNSAGQFVAYSTKVGQDAVSGRIRKEFQVPDSHQRVLSPAGPVFPKGKFLKRLTDRLSHLYGRPGWPRHGSHRAGVYA